MTLQTQHNNTDHITIHNTQTIAETFAQSTCTKNITLEKNAHCQYLGIIQDSNVTIDIHTPQPGSTAHVTLILVSKNQQATQCHCTAHLQSNNVTIHLTIASFLAAQGTLTIDGGVTIHPGVAQVAGHLTEKTVICGTNTTIRAIPKLDVHANDVQASHGASIDTIDPQRLFYMQAKGLTKPHAQQLMIAGHINHLLQPFALANPDYAKQQEDCLLRYLLDD